MAGQSIPTLSCASRADPSRCVSRITSADDFVAKAATQSSLSDEPYMLRLSDGRLVNLADYLRSELQSLN